MVSGELRKRTQLPPTICEVYQAVSDRPGTHYVRKGPWNLIDTMLCFKLRAGLLRLSLREQHSNHALLSHCHCHPRCPDFSSLCSFSVASLGKCTRLVPVSLPSLTIPHATQMSNALYLPSSSFQKNLPPGSGLINACRYKQTHLQTDEPATPPMNKEKP